MRKRVERKTFVCEYCKKEFVDKCTRQRKYCSLSCRSSVTSKMAGAMGGRKAVETHRKNHTGFFDFKIQSMGGKIGGKKAAETNKRNKTGLYGMTHIQCMANGRKSAEINKRNRTGLFDLRIQKMGQSIGGKIGGVKAIKTLRERVSHPKYEGISFDSKQEMLCAQKFKEKLNFAIVQNITTHVAIGHKEYDFLLNTTFIDYHPVCIHSTHTKYYEERRKVLDENGYKDYEYVVLKSMREVDDFIIGRETLCLQRL